MKFRTLQENLRKTLWQYIDAGESPLASGGTDRFKQAHISNFLNASATYLEGMTKF